MKNNYIKSERMWNVCLTYVYRMFYVISILFTIGTGQSWAADDKFGNGQIIYCKVNNTNWNGHAIQFNWYWDSGTWCSTENGNKITTNYWYHSVPNAYIGKVQFIRCKSDFSEQWDWSNEATAAGRSNNYQNCVEITGSNWGGATVSWTTYRPAMSSASVVDNGTTKTGSGTSLSPYQVVTGETIKLSASCVSAVSDNAMTAQYKYFNKGSQLRDYSSTNTYSFTAGAAGTTYEITVKARNNYNSGNGTESGASTTLYYTVIAEPETTHEVTISYKCGGTTIKSDDTEDVGEETASSFDVVDIAGYTFSSWSLGNGLTNESGSTTADPISITTKSSGTYTLTANYTEDLTSTWYLLGNNTSIFPGSSTWSAHSSNMLQKASGHSTEDEGSLTINVRTLPANNSNYQCKIFNDDGDHWWGWTNGNTYNVNGSAHSNITLHEANNNNLYFIPNALGEYTFKVDWSGASPVLNVTWPTSYTVNFGVRSGGSSATATYSSTSFNTGTKVQTGKSVTFTQSASTGYEFAGWYNASSGGTKVSTNEEYTTTVGAATLNAYAAFTAKTYAGGVLDKNGGSSDGSYTVTYNATSITPSAPTRTGYHVEGYYTNAGCSIKVASPAGVLEKNKAGYTDADGHWNYDGIKRLYTKWEANTYTGANNLDKTIGDVNGRFTATYNATTIAINTTPTKTGYDVEGYYKTYTSSPDTWTTKVATPAGALQPSTGYTDATNHWTNDGNVTLYTKWSAHTYTVTLTPGEGGSGSNGTMTVDYDATAYKTFSHSITQTGYHINGWYDNSASLKVLDADGTFAGSSISGYITSSKWAKAANCTLQAWWDPNDYTVTLDVDEDHQGTISGATTSHTVTYNTVTTDIPNLPTAENGYGLEGYYTDHNGAGTKVIDYDGKWIASVDGYTDADKKWVHDGNVTLYAYYKKAEITSLVLTPSTQAPGESVTATPTIYPTPVGDKMLCWKLLRANGNPMDPQPAEWAPGEGNAVSFDAPATSGSYKVACILRTGSSCDAGTVLDSVVADLVVAGAHTVTIQYQDGSGRTLAASAETIGRPLEWSDEIEPATITGYTFARWDAGDGVYLTDDNGTTTKTTTTTAAIKIKATYDGTLTAVYTKKRMIYFYNTLNWENVYVYFYKNNSYWGAASQGTGANTSWQFDSYPYSEGKHGQMLPMEEGSKIYYFDAEAAGVNASYTNVAFTELEQHGCDYFWNGNKVARRSDYKSGSLPLFVPLADQTGTSMNGGAAMYYNDGYWMNYPDNTGYTLKIYDSQGATTPIRTLRFPFSEDTKMPLKLDVEFNSPGTTFYYTIYREDGDVLSADYGMNQNYHSDVPLTDPSKKIRITTTATGIYTYTLVYKDSPSKNYFISVDYPIGQDDYRVWYSDNATWSQGSAHSGSWHHASDVIRKNTDAEVTKYDTVSFYVSKGNDITVTMKFQYASAIAEGGTITWTDVTSGGIGAADTISNAGVYNFIIKQVGTANPVVEKVEKYSGNYYIRTDNAGSTKWDYYRAADHQMTYSEFSKSRSTNTFGELYTHYYMHWCPRSTNIKFCIANDYSPCISDTLESDLTDWGNLSEGAWLKSDGANPDYKDKYSANIRFMYNESTNKISRAYLSSSTNTDRKFLILRSNTKFWNGDGTDLSGTGETSDDVNHVYEAIFQDNEDWIYEREIRLTPSSKFKLYASYAQAIPSENGSQYFRGAYADNNWSNSDNYVLLIGGEGSPCKARIIYDFKTNRLLAAYLPDNSEIEGTLDIDADLMIIREHQEAGQQITFKTNASQLTDVKTVYGVMRFNRWTLNNRANPEDHDKDHSRAATINTYHPLLGLGSQKSMYERALYWISFPFDVNLSDVFGFGTYGVHWIMMDYNGAERARIGYWKDNDEGFWEYIEDRRGVTLKAGKGYVLALELELMQATDTINFWHNQIQQVELFFPSTSSTTGTISQTDVNVTVDSHLCTIDRRTDKTVDDWNNDRRIADSHWNIIGVPSYANYGSTLTDAGGIVNWQTYSKTANLPFLYEWNANDNTYTAQSGSRYNFKAMHAYYVQYAGTLHWTLASATPSSIVARRTYAEEPENVEFRLELQQNDKMIDQTFVKMSNDEEVSANFAFGEDMDKEFNAGKANVYTFIEGYIPTAGNTLPMSDETTIVPVGVKITSAGEYTFAIPEGTEGIGVTLIDNVANTRTNLSALDYTVNLTAGTHDGRFLLEISPIHNAPTDIEAVTGDGLPANGARKVLIDGILYIVKGDKLYDVRGTMIK